MKLLFDENLSPRLVRILEKEFPESTHIESEAMRGGTDADIWNHARINELTIVSKDNDFRQRAFLYGYPPKVVWLSVGNTGTEGIASLLRASHSKVIAFIEDPGESLLVLTRDAQ